MVNLSKEIIHEFFKRTDDSNNSYEKGQALEDVICYIFEQVPGISVSKRNVLNYSRSEEIDIAFWNEQKRVGFHFLPIIILAECKNWSRPVSNAEISYFDDKLENRGLDFGILIAANGITGSGEKLDRAHSGVASSLSKGRRIIILTREEIETLRNTATLIRLIKEKLCELVAQGTVLIA